MRTIWGVLRWCAAAAAVVLALAPTPASASPGCDAVNAGALNQTVTDGQGFNVTVSQAFDAGDKLTATFTQVSGNFSPGHWLINNGIFDHDIAYSPSNGATLQLTYGNPGFYANHQMTLNGTGTGTVTATVVCTPAGTATSTALSSSINPSVVGQSVTFTATVTPEGGAGTPTGTVTFKDGSTTLGTGTLSGGSATFTTSSLAFGAHSITAEYGGDATFSASTSPALTQSVDTETSATTLSAAPNPSNLGQDVTLTATVTNPSLAFVPTGTIEFRDLTTGTTLGLVLFVGGAGPISRSITVSTLAAGSHSLQAHYSGGNYIDNGGVVHTVGPSDSNTVTQVVNQAATTTALSSSQNPSNFGQAVTFTATVANGGGTPTGTVTFKDGATTLGTGTLNGSGVATFTISTLAVGSHSITATYEGNANFAASVSPAVVQAVNVPVDSLRLRALQVAVTKLEAQSSGQAIAGAIGSAIAEGFSGGGAPIVPSDNGMRFNFAAEWPAQSDADDGNVQARVGDAFEALAYARRDSSYRMPIKAPPPAPRPQPRDWLAWAEIRGIGWNTSLQAGDIRGGQTNALLGVTRRVSSTFLVGVFGGYETFNYSSQLLNGRLKGDGWTVGGYLGWKLAGGLRFDAGIARSGIGYDGQSGTAIGSFPGQRWLVSGGLTGTYKMAPWFEIEPSARVYGLWEREDAYLDSLGTQQAGRTFSTGRGSAGTKLTMPLAWTDTISAAPYAGLYADYYFNKDDAAAGNLLLPIEFVQGWSARVTGGISLQTQGGIRLAVGGELGGLGAGDFTNWTVRGQAAAPF